MFMEGLYFGYRFALFGEEYLVSILNITVKINSLLLLFLWSLHNNAL